MSRGDYEKCRDCKWWERIIGTNHNGRCFEPYIHKFIWWSDARDPEGMDRTKKGIVADDYGCVFWESKEEQADEQGQLSEV